MFYAAATLVASFATAFAHGIKKPELAADTKDAYVTLVCEHRLPVVPGKSGTGVLVKYCPSGYDSPLTDAKSALIFATVLEGAIECVVNGAETKTSNPGQNFTELPGNHHDVSANANKTKSAKLLTGCVIDTDDAAQAAASFGCNLSGTAKIYLAFLR